MKKQLNVTLIASVVMLVIAVAVWIAIPYGIAETASATDIGPRAFPRVICGAIAVLSALQLVLVLTGVQKGKTAEICWREQLPVLLAMVLALAAVFCAKFVNLLVAGVLCAEGFLLVLRAKNWRYYLAVAVTGGLLFVLMKFVMNIRF